MTVYYAGTYPTFYGGPTSPGVGANYCYNPSFEQSLFGWSALVGTAISQSSANVLWGSQAMQVVTDGSVAGEGVFGPLGPDIIGAATTGAISFSIYPLTAGTLNVEAVTATGTVLSSTLVTVTPGRWQRVVLQGFSAPVGRGFGLLLATTVPQAITYWVDGVMYELGVTTAHPYGDGDQLGWQWLGGHELSYSQELYLAVNSASGSLKLNGRATPVQIGEQFYTTAEGYLTLSGDLQLGNAPPNSVFKDFGIFELTDPDPAMSYVDQNNAGQTTGIVTAYTLFDFETIAQVGPSNWSSNGGPLTQSSAWSNSGKYSMLLTANGTANTNIAYSFNVTAGQNVNASAWVNLSRSQAIDLDIDWYNGVTYLSTSHAGNRTVAANTPTQFSLVNVTAPVSTTIGHLYWSFNPSSGDLVYTDDVSVAVGAGYNRHYGVFYPPLDYLVSGEKYLWHRAAYAGLGFYLTATPASQEYNLTNFQAELAPFTGSTLVPAAYQPPRQLATIIKPTRLNYCTNPSFEVSTANWSTTGTASLSQDPIAPPAAYQTLLQAGALGAFFNNTGITNDGATGTGNFGDGSNTYSAQQLVLSNLGPGQLISSGGISYMMPAVAAGTPDNISAQGQTIPIGGPAGASVIGFLGASVSGGLTGLAGPVTINYSDGSIATLTLGLSDWTLDAGLTTPNFGNQIAGNIPYRNAGNTKQIVTTYIFSQILPLNPAKAVASITLPSVTNMHIFAVSLANATSSFGRYSGKVTVHANGDGIAMTVPNLIVGDTYTVSAYVQAGPGTGALTMSCGSGIVTLSNTVLTGTPYGGTAGIGYGQGYYGGIPPATSDLPTGVWFQPYFIFTANASTQTLALDFDASADTTYPTEFWVDAVLFEAGAVLGTYFDGSFGSTGYQDYQWEAGGTPGLTRSYYYQQLNVKKYSIQEVLNQHIPVGLTAQAPKYLIPYTQ